MGNRLSKTRDRLAKILIPSMKNDDLRALCCRLRDGTASEGDRKHAALVISTLLPRKRGRPPGRYQNQTRLYLYSAFECEKIKLLQTKPPREAEAIAFQRLLEERDDNISLNTLKRYVRDGRLISATQKNTDRN